MAEKPRDRRGSALRRSRAGPDDVSGKQLTLDIYEAAVENHISDMLKPQGARTARWSTSSGAVALFAEVGEYPAPTVRQ